MMKLNLYMPICGWILARFIYALNMLFFENITRFTSFPDLKEGPPTEEVRHCFYGKLSTGLERDVISRDVILDVGTGLYIDWMRRPWFWGMNFLDGKCYVIGKIHRDPHGSGHLGQWKADLLQASVVLPPIRVAMLEILFIYFLYNAFMYTVFKMPKYGTTGMGGGLKSGNFR
jgi:hypothetical protein